MVKKLIINSEHPEGIIIEAPDEVLPPRPKSDAERIFELEAQLAALTEGYAEGVNQA